MIDTIIDMIMTVTTSGVIIIMITGAPTAMIKEVTIVTTKDATVLQRNILARNCVKPGMKCTRSNDKLGTIIVVLIMHAPIIRIRQSSSVFRTLYFNLIGNRIPALRSK